MHKNKRKATIMVQYIDTNTLFWNQRALVGSFSRSLARATFVELPLPVHIDHQLAARTFICYLPYRRKLGVGVVQQLVFYSRLEKALTCSFSLNWQQTLCHASHRDSLRTTLFLSQSILLPVWFNRKEKRGGENVNDAVYSDSQFKIKLWREGERVRV